MLKNKIVSYYIILQKVVAYTKSLFTYKLSHMLSVSLLLLFATSFSGCAKKLCFNNDVSDLNAIIQQMYLQNIFDKIAEGLCENNSNKTFLVTDFVDIKTHKSGRSGLFMGELLRGSLNSKCDAKILQADFGSSFRVGKDGVKVLTRDVNSLNKYDYKKTYSIVGTFNMTPEALYIFTKKINVRSSKVVEQVNEKVPFTCISGSVVNLPF
jgi:hypothetical protein